MAVVVDYVHRYIHRVGRTARFDKVGKALLLLLPSEAEMVPLLLKKGAVLTKTEMAADKTISVKPILESLCASDTDLKYLAQKYFISYLRSIFLQSNKQVFDVEVSLKTGGCVCERERGRGNTG